MQTHHRVVVDDARRLHDVEDDSVELVVTSPPYPMIEMWDELFTNFDPAVGECLDEGDGRAAFDLMHAQLEEVWAEVERVLVDGGVACVNVGDATRKVDGSFRVYGNHARIVEAFEGLGFDPLPEILWRKPVNSAAKFMGSGMLPPNAYVTLEHEYILVFRKGSDRRAFEPLSDRRYESAYFWEERNRWFSDVWTDITGELQALDRGDLRSRSAAFPFEIPYRLINMYSLCGDTVLDPFWGTGTTSLAALVGARNSIGYEIETEFTRVFDDRVTDVPAMSREVVRRRLADHHDFVAGERTSGSEFEYAAENYGFPVRTKQEVGIQFYAVDGVEELSNGYRATHEPVEADGVDTGSSRRTDSKSVTDF